MTFPETFSHHGLIYARSIDALPDGRFFVEYKCVSHPDLGPDVRGEIESLAPGDAYVQAAMSAIHYQISEAITQIAILLDKGKGAEAPSPKQPSGVISSSSSFLNPGGQ